jgi:hypothetical protein
MLRKNNIVESNGGKIVLSSYGRNWRPVTGLLGPDQIKLDSA